MIVDAFTVTGGCQVRPIKVGIDQLRAAMDKNGVDLAMTMSLRAIQTDAAVGNDYIYEVARKNPRILPVAVLDPRNCQHIEVMIAKAVSREAVALAFHMTAISCPVNSILFGRVLKGAAATGKPLVFVTNTAGELSRIAEMTRDLGCKKVLLAGASYHRGGELLALLEEFDHIYVEASWQISPGIIKLLTDAGGADRILFGSMAPLRPMRPAINMIADAELVDTAKANILARNALRFLGREEQAATVGDDVPQVQAMPTVPVIDVHCHFRVNPEIPATCLGGDDIEKELGRFNIEYAVMSSTAAYKDDMNLGNQEMLDGISTHERMLGSVTVNVHHFEDSVKWLDIAANDPRIVHVTISPGSTYERFSSGAWLRLLAEVAARKLPVFWNSGGQDIYRRDAGATVHGHILKVRGAAPDEVELFRRAAELFPQMPIILGHGHGMEGLELARTYGNFYLDLCTTYPEQNVYRRAIDMVGVDRIVFGSDLELISPAFVLGSMWEAELNEQEQQKILRENACRILKLPR